ncbi:MAG: tetratricopeptide repeat protein, partial [Polyangiales bacterium]
MASDESSERQRRRDVEQPESSGKGGKQAPHRQNPDVSASMESLLEDLEAESEDTPSAGSAKSAPAKPASGARKPSSPPTPPPVPGAAKAASKPPPPPPQAKGQPKGQPTPRVPTKPPPAPTAPPSKGSSPPGAPAKAPPPPPTPGGAKRPAGPKASSPPPPPAPSAPRPHKPAHAQLDATMQETPPDPFAERARELIKACEHELTQDPGPRRAARLHYEIARLFESPLADLRRAAAHYQEALQRAPEHLPTLRGARRVLIARRSYNEALELFDAEARITSDPRRKAALYLQKGRLLEDVLGQTDKARQPYNTAHELDRTNASILKALEQTQLAASAWDALDRTWERSANAVSADARHRAALIVERARLIESRRGDIGERAAGGAATSTELAIELYENALELDPHAHDALEALKRLHTRQRRWRDLIGVLELEVSQAQDPGVRTMALYRIGRLHAEQLGNRDEALNALERAVADAPRNPLILEELARLYEAAGRMDSLVEVMQSLVDVAASPEQRLGLLHRMGQLYADELEQEDAAVHCFESARRIQPTFVPALQALGTIYTRRRDWEALVQAHLGEAEHADEPRRRAAAHTRVAELLETHLGRTDEACDHYARALSLVPGYPPAFKALVRLLSAAGRWRDLVELYERAVDLAKTPAKTVTFLFKIGAIYEDSLGEHVQAAHTYRRILQVERDNLGAIQALQRATERAGRFQELVEALDLEIEHTKDNEEVVTLLHRAAEVLDDHLEDRDGALKRLRRALELDPKHGPSLASIGRIYHRMGRWEDLLDVYERELQLGPKGPAAVGLLQKMAELCEHHLGSEDEAIARYRRILDIDATHAPALHELQRLLHDRGDHKELASSLELELKGLQDAEPRARVAFRLGEVYEQRLEQQDKAIAAYQQALQAEPDYRPAVDALARLRAEKKQWAPLAKELARDAGSTPDPSLAVSALVREGEIFAEQLDDTRKAIEAFEQVLERAPSHLGALLALERLYRRVGQWDSLAGVYERQAKVLGDAGGQVAALHELARLRERHGVGTAEDLEVAYQAILQRAPDDAIALDGLERLALSQGDRGMLIGVDARLSTQAQEHELKAAHQTRLAESLEAAGDPSALEAYRTALEHDPESIAATRGLSRLAEQMNDPQALAEAARREAQVAGDSDTAARLLVRSAEVRTDRLGDIEGAVSDLERAIELCPDHAEAAERLADVLRGRGEAARLADLLTHAAGRAKNAERATALWTQVAKLQADALDNIPGAISSLNRLLRTAPNHVPTLRKLADLYERDEQWTEAVNLLGRVVQLAPDRDVLKDTHLRLAALWGERLGETSRALVSLQAVLALDSENRRALEALADLQEREGKIDKAAEAAERLVAATQDAEAKATALLRLARLRREQQRDQEAADALRQALVLDGPGGEAAIEYKSTLSSPSEWESYVRALGEHLAKADGQVVPVHLEMARVQFDQLGQVEAALATLRQAIEQTGDAALRQELAMRLRLARRYDGAVTELQRLVQDDVSRVETWRELARTFEEWGQPQAARLASEPLVVFGAAGRRELEQAGAAPSHPGHAHAGSLDPEVLRSICGFSGGEQRAASLLTALGPALPKLYPPDLDGYGLSPRDKVTTKSGHPVRVLADRLAAIVGVNEFA